MLSAIAASIDGGGGSTGAACDKFSKGLLSGITALASHARASITGGAKVVSSVGDRGACGIFVPFFVGAKPNANM